MTARPINPTAAAGFARAGAEYERGRPGYPPDAIELLARELRIGAGREVLDLAAGTGKLTRLITATGAHTIAVEPVPEMREQLLKAVPGAEVLEGTAESLPLDDQSVDVVLVAQAFHWFDAPRALREIHRVLRPEPDSGLGVIWNAWDESVPWIEQLQRMVHGHAGDTPRHDTSNWQQTLAGTGMFTDLRQETIPYRILGDRDTLLARVASISYIAALDTGERTRLLERVAQIAPEAPIETRYLTHVTWSRPVRA